MTWLDDVRAAPSGAPLLHLLRRRLLAWDEEGPVLDDRRGEAPEEVFVHLARGDSGFAERLDETIAGYFKASGATPSDGAEALVSRGLLELVQRLPLTGVFTALRAWFDAHETALRADPNAILARAALGAMAAAQPRTRDTVRELWQNWWRDGPEAWQPVAFIGLRRQDPAAAAAELPLLLRRAEERSQDAGALLQGMWQQPDASRALVDALRASAPWAEEARRALLRRLPPPRRAQLAAELGEGLQVAGEVDAANHTAAVERAFDRLGSSYAELLKRAPPRNVQATFAGAP